MYQIIEYCYNRLAIANAYPLKYIPSLYSSLLNIRSGSIWGQACKSYLDKLLNLQKQALRFICFCDHNEHAIPLFVDAHILLLKFVYYESIANLMFDIRNRITPSNIQDLFQDI